MIPIALPAPAVLPPVPDLMRSISPEILTDLMFAIASRGVRS